MLDVAARAHVITKAQIAARAHMKQELVVIIEIAKLLERPLDPPRTVQGILRLLAQMRGLNCGRVVMPNESRSTLEVRYSYGLSPSRLVQGGYTLAFDEGVTGYVMRTGSIGLVPDVDSEPLYIQRITERGAPRGTQPGERLAFLAVPILEAGTPIGVLSVQREGLADRPFDNDISLLRVAAAAIGQVLRIHKFVLEQTEHLVKENQTLKNDIVLEGMLNKSLSHGIIGSSRSLMDAVRQSIQVAKSDAPVMLLGESGTGKEKFARMIHQQSDRREKAFICINCAAIPSDLLESELFGHEKGSFTGAAQAKKGKIVLADGGTLFLDEIGDMPMELQSKLLRVLQEKQVDPVGSTQPMPVNFRIITATHVNLQESVNAGRFRLDLFYRLNVVPIALPALRERKADIKQLALHFLNELNHQYSRNITLELDALRVLERYEWPGNIRQLQNVLERAMLMAETAVINGLEVQRILREESTIQVPEASLAQADRIQRGTLAQGARRVSGLAGDQRGYEWVGADQAREIIEAVRQARGNKTQAARLLNMSLRQLRYRIAKLGLESQLEPSG